MKSKNVILANIAFIGISFILMFIITFHTINLLISNNNEEQAKIAGAKVLDELNNLMEKPLTISETMANDYTFHKLIENHDENEFIRYLSSLQNHFGLFTTYFADDETLIYHTYSGQTTLVNKEKPSSAWYWKLKEEKNNFTITTAINNQKGGIPTIYVNYKVYSQKGKFLGVCGAGVEFKDLSLLFKKYEENYGLKIYYMDEAGNILTGFDNVQSENLTLAHKYFEKTQNFIYHQNGKKGYVISRYIKSVDKFLVVVKEAVPKTTSQILIYYKIISLFVLFGVLIVVVGSYAIHEQKLLRKKAITDKMTGFFNKFGFMEEAILKIHGENKNIAFLFMDLDNFKSVNDKLGHAMGDKAIIDAAKTIKASLRKTDLIGRFGGDEFVVCMVNIEEEKLNEILKELVESLKATYSDGKEKVKVTTSIGAVYGTSDKNLDIDSLLQIADDAMYKVKTSGKNNYFIKELE